MMKGGLGKLMKQAQKMQEDMKKAQEELASLEVIGVAGGDMVQVVMNCKHEVRQVKIDDALIGEDKDMLEDLIAAAMNDCAKKVEKATQEKMSGLTAGLPPGMNLPF
ncbi:MAG: YbaB/EbfC family nucleoid-associated protein [Pseudomonadota bacterium]